MDDKTHLVQTQLEAYNSFDLELFCSCYHQNVVVKSFSDNSIIIEGLDNFRPFYKNLFDTFPQQKCILKSRILRGDFILDEEIIQGRPTHPEGRHVVAIYGFRDGLIDRVWFI